MENISYSDHEAVQVDYVIDNNNEDKISHKEVQDKLLKDNNTQKEINGLLSTELRNTMTWQMEYLIWMMPITFCLFSVPILLAFFILICVYPHLEEGEVKEKFNPGASR